MIQDVLVQLASIVINDDVGWCGEPAEEDLKWMPR